MVAGAGVVAGSATNGLTGATGAAILASTTAASVDGAYDAKPEP